jgi:hypothetical protein
VAELVDERERGDGADEAEGERRILQVQPGQQQQTEQEPGRDRDREAEDREGGTVADRPDRMAARPSEAPRSAIRLNSCPTFLPLITSTVARPWT